ncbi:MAG: FtsX-like permease family protein, partial [Olleya sp.]
VKGVGADYNWQYFKDFLIEGRLPDYTQKLNPDILLSKYLANRLQLKLNDRINTYFLKEDTSKTPYIRTFNIVGIYDSGLQEFDQLYLIGDIRHIRKFNQWDDDQVGRFEVFIDDYNTLETTGNAIFKEVPSNLNAKTVDKEYPFIFEWIKIFDNNIYAIIGIMILVAGINMITALLVLILERTQMIGILKALGSANLSIRKIFLYNAAYLILKGLFWGNLIGISLLLLQKYFGLFPLDPKTYHVSAVPVYINIGYIIALNIGTFVLCLLMLLVPSYIISKISPIKAIRFD